MKLIPACFLKFAMVISFKTTKTAKWNSKKRQISSQKQNDNSANWLPQNVHARKRQLSPFQNILEMNLPIAIFREKNAYCIILHLYHVSKAKRHSISQFGNEVSWQYWFEIESCILRKGPSWVQVQFPLNILENFYQSSF